MRRRELSEAAIAIARQVDDDTALGHALAAHCDVVAGPDDCELRDAEASEIIELARRSRDGALELLGRRLRFQARLEVGDMTGADEDRTAFAGLADELRQPQHRWYVPLWQGMRSLMLGDLTTARTQCELAQQLGERAASLNAHMLVMTQRWVLERLEGHFAEVGEWMSDALGLAPGGTPVVSGADELRMRALMAVHRGDLEGAHALLDAVTPSVLEARPRNSEWLPETAQLAQVAVATGHEAAAAAVFAELEPYAHR